MVIQKTNKWMLAMAIVAAVCSSAAPMIAFVPNSLIDNIGRHANTPAATSRQASATAQPIRSTASVTTWNGATTGRSMPTMNSSINPWKVMAGGAAATTAAWVIKKAITRR